MDEFWKYVEKVIKGDMLNPSQGKKDFKLMCKFCGAEYAPDTSISRMKVHLSGITGRGAGACPNVPDDVKKKAQDAAEAVSGPNKKQKTMNGASTSNAGGGYGGGDVLVPQTDQDQPFPTTGVSDAEEGRESAEVPGTQEQNNADGMSVDYIDQRPTLTPAVRAGLEASTLWSPTTFTGAGIDFMMGSLSLAFGSSDQVIAFTGDLPNLGDEQPRPVMGNFSEREPGFGEVIVHEGHIDKPREAMKETTLTTLETCPMQHLPTRRDHVLESGKEDVNTEALRIAKGDILLTTEVVGRTFTERKREIWSWLMDDNVSCIGIYGMGGVGKTALVTHINNQLQETPNPFHHVYWITVGQDFSIFRLQNLIAKTISLYLSDEDDEKKRASRLYHALVEKKKFVLILDDLWNHFLSTEVGIPVGRDECKLIITTRLLPVSRFFSCQKVMKVEPLNKEEAWTLFMRTLGRELSPVVKSVADECAGLPLGIITMAGCMKGEDDDAHEWRYALGKLRESEVSVGEMEDEVFRILRFSYTRLRNQKWKECFLYCALFPEDFEIEKDDLIGYLIDEGIIEGASREGEVDEGHAILNKLVNACLLETTTDKSRVRMHDLIRDMALQELRKKPHAMVETSMGLRDFPRKEKWTEDLVKVSVMRSNISKIPSDLSPNCPHLSTLLLCQNSKLGSVGHSFFLQFHALKVLDVSRTDIRELPSSFSHLASLKALIARWCRELRHIPSLAKLRDLQRLDLSGSGLIALPQGMEQLTRLRYLNLKGTISAEFPSGILPNLPDLQVLIIPQPITVTDMACLTKLETLQCNLYNDVSELSKPSCKKLWQALRQCKIVIGRHFNLWDMSTGEIFDSPLVEGRKKVYWWNDGSEEAGKMLPKGIQQSQLQIMNCKVGCGTSHVQGFLLERKSEIERD